MLLALESHPLLGLALMVAFVAWNILELYSDWQIEDSIQFLVPTTL